MPKSLLSAKHDESGPCGLTKRYFYNTCQEKAGWVSKKVNNQQKEKPLKSPLYHQREKPKGPLQGGIKHQNNARASLDTIFYNFLKLCNLSISYFNFDQSTYTESHKAKH